MTPTLWNNPVEFTEQNSTKSELNNLKKDSEFNKDIELTEINEDYSKMNDIISKIKENPFTIGNREFYWNKTQWMITLVIYRTNYHRKYSIHANAEWDTTYMIQWKKQYNEDVKKEIDEFIEGFNKNLDENLKN